MADPATVKAQIRAAFANVPYPGDRFLRSSDEGEEPLLLERDFTGKRDWRMLDREFIDRAPDGYGSALGFFSDEALRFYLPAYLIADVDRPLDRADPVFHLTHGLTDAGRDERVNPLRYGQRTWFEATSHRLAVFDRAQAAAIVAYLRFKRKDRNVRPEIDQALRNFWLARAGEHAG